MPRKPATTRSRAAPAQEATAWQLAPWDLEVWPGGSAAHPPEPRARGGWDERQQSFSALFQSAIAPVAKKAWAAAPLDRQRQGFFRIGATVPQPRAQADMVDSLPAALLSGLGGYLGAVFAGQPAPPEFSFLDDSGTYRFWATFSVTRGTLSAEGVPPSEPLATAAQGRAAGTQAPSPIAPPVETSGQTAALGRMEVEQGEKTAEERGTVPPTESSREGRQARAALAREAFADLPREAGARLAALLERVDVFREVAREHMQTAVSAFLHVQSPEQFEAKQAVVALVNAALERLGLAVRYQGQACYLAATVGDEYPRGRFLIVPKGSKKPLLTRTHLADLPELQLMDAVPREGPPPPSGGAADGSWRQREGSRRPGRPSSQR